MFSTAAPRDSCACMLPRLQTPSSPTVATPDCFVSRQPCLQLLRLQTAAPPRAHTPRPPVLLQPTPCSPPLASHIKVIPLTPLPVSSQAFPSASPSLTPSYSLPHPSLPSSSSSHTSPPPPPPFTLRRPLPRLHLIRLTRHHRGLLLPPRAPTPPRHLSHHRHHPLRLRSRLQRSRSPRAARPLLNSAPGPARGRRGARSGQPARGGLPGSAPAHSSRLGRIRGAGAGPLLKSSRDGSV